MFTSRESTFNTPAPIAVALMFAVVLAVVPGLSLAHSSVTVTDPMDDAVLDKAPETVVLRFSDAVYLDSFSLVDGQGNPVTLQFELPQASSRRFSIPLPVLPKGTYTVLWSMADEDFHAGRGELTFTIQPAGQE